MTVMTRACGIGLSVVLSGATSFAQQPVSTSIRRVEPATEPAGADASRAPAPAPVPATVVAAVSGAADYQIGPQDLLSVTVFDQPDLSGKYAVELDGTFTFPFIGRVTAGGLTIRAFESALRTSLADGFFKNPQVAVAVEAYRSQRVFVVGEVKTPGALPLTGGLTLMEAVARAGSTTEDASDEVVIVRGGRGAGPATTHSAGVDAAGKEVLRVDLRTLRQGAGSLTLQDGDTVFVGRVEPVYVYGQVKTPGSYPIRSGTTVLQALSLAGGGTPTAAVNRARVIRMINGVKTEFRVDLTDRVMPGDTIMVPERFF